MSSFDEQRLEINLHTLKNMIINLENYLNSLNGTYSAGESTEKELIANLKSKIVEIQNETILLMKKNIGLLADDGFFSLVSNKLENASRDIGERIRKEGILSEKLNGIFRVVDTLKSDIHGQYIHLINANKAAQRFIRVNLEPKIKEVEEKLIDIERAKIAYQNNGLLDVFKHYQKNLKAEGKKWELGFFISIICGFLCTLVSLGFSKRFELWDYVFLKVSIVAVTITFATYFLRRSVHLIKQSDQIERYAMEMDALPSFISSLNEESRNLITVELVHKYFGKDTDQTQNDKIGDLMKDQLTAGTELIKASAELVKAKSSPPSSK
ncbi:hypothetical protein QR674_12585 [Acinetobacter chinensis]|uniref:Chemotaxis protein n=1 Tax=Acinetobacter chinensis TaxID=2004650 RepID=A0ABU3WHD9_9GAMM|nr:hypothetical protein [Acinetobacter chinensis]MDV2469817.1 hypothetical protein [Acinetobacter chinensis]